MTGEIIQEGISSIFVTISSKSCGCVKKRQVIYLTESRSIDISAQTPATKSLRVSICLHDV